MSLPADLARYRYDPLDRLIEVAGNQRFYTQTRLATEIQGAVHRSVFQSGDQLLAERGVSDCTLLATDQQGSVLHTASADKSQSIAYTAYGHRPAESGLLSLLGFNGERPDPMTGHYLLGNGYRAFNPVLMRFNSPDNWSPFGQGGLNCYGYCGGDSINRTDPSGHVPGFLLKSLVSIFGNKDLKRAILPNITIAGGVGQEMTTYKNVRRLAQGVYMADLPVHGQKPIAIFNAHGGYDKAGAFLKSGDKDLNILKFVNILKTRKIKMSKYQGFELYVCHSADGGLLSFANKLHERYRMPVTGYRGKVFGYNDPLNVFEDKMPVVKALYSDIQMIRKLTVPTGTDIFRDVGTAKLFKPDIESEFNYDPVTYR